MQETYQKSLDKHLSQVLCLYWLLLGQGGGVGNFLSFPLALFSSTSWLTLSYCRSAGFLHCGKDKKIFCIVDSTWKASSIKVIHMRVDRKSYKAAMMGNRTGDPHRLHELLNSDQYLKISKWRDLMYSTGRDSSDRQRSFFDPIALFCFGGVLQAFCEKTNVSSQHIVQMCVLPSWRIPGHHQWNRQKGKQNCRNCVCSNPKTQSLTLVMWWNFCTSPEGCVTGQCWNPWAFPAHLSLPLCSAL